MKNLYRFGFLVLEGIFLGTVTLLASHPIVISPFMFIVMGLATMRTAKALSYNEVFEPLRAPFTYVKPDSCGAGANVHPKTGKNGERTWGYIVGSLLSCPICTGTWSALALYSFQVFVPTFGTSLAYILGLAGLQEILHWTSEAVEWAGRMFRVIAGFIAPDKKESDNE